MVFLLLEKYRYKTSEIMKKEILSICFLFMAITTIAQSTSFDEKANAYIKQYAAWAIEEQQRVGIPASIILAQGIYETGAGESELATQANNHFGIKCKKEWTGATFAHTDDAPDECFRKYPSAKESYIDHSDYLRKSARYAELFTYPVKNYTAWAKGLKRCGYATNPAYAHKLIKMIEDYDLQQYTLVANGERANEVVPQRTLVKDQVQDIRAHDALIAPARKPITELSNQETERIVTHEDGTIRINNLRAFYAKKGEMLLDKAMKYNIRYARLLEINELADEPLQRDMPIFLEPKKFKGAHAVHTVQEGETVEMIAHNEGMGSRQLRIFNLMAQNEQPVVGSVLKLQEQSDERPVTYRMIRAQAEPVEQNFRLQDPAQKQSDDYISTKKNVQKTEEIEMGYGAERPSFLQEKKNIVINDKQHSDVIVEEKKIEEKKVEEKKVQPQQPQDEISLLKARLDKAVYGRTSNIKVSSSDSNTLIADVPSVTNSKDLPNKNATTTEMQYHTVEKGDTGYSIAKKYGIKVKQLNEWNNLNFDGIKVGQKLRVK
jgi:LysM repeat protein